MVGAWCLLKGLQNLLNLSSSVSATLEKGKEGTPKGKTTEVPKTKEGAGSPKPTSAKG